PEQGLKVPELLGGEPGFGPGVGLGDQLLGRLAGEFHPSINGGSSTAEEVGDVVGGFPLLDKFDGTKATTLEFLGGSDRSHTWNTSRTNPLFSWLDWSQ